MIRTPPISTPTDTLFPSPTHFRSTPAEIAAPIGQTDTPQEGNNMNSREYAEAVRQLRANLKGRPIDDSPEYAALQAQYTGRPPAAAGPAPVIQNGQVRSEAHTSELQSLMRISYAVFCLQKKT